MVTSSDNATTLRSARVLLVEDNPVNLMVGQRLLGVLGITCDTASNGEAALTQMTASRYDLVLMDCQMPVMDGYTAPRRWREREALAADGRHLPIVAMTANAMAGDRQKCLDRSEEHTSELQSLMRISYAGCCIEKKQNKLTK